MPRRVVSRRRLRSNALRRAMALAALAVPALAVALVTPGQVVVNGNAALLPSGAVQSILPSGLLPTLVPTPVPSPLVTCVPLPDLPCTDTVLSLVPGALGGPSPNPTNSHTPGGGPTPDPGPTTTVTTPGNGPVFIAPPVPPDGALSLLPATLDQLSPDGFALLLSTGIKGGLSISADQVWPVLAAAQVVLLLALLGWLVFRRPAPTAAGS